jgi:ABC-type sugar transport system permease subunit
MAHQELGVAPSAVRTSGGAVRMIGAVLLLPALLAWVWSYLLPTITTVVRSFQRYNGLAPAQPAGTRNYTSAFDFGFAVGFGLRLIVVPLVAGLLVAPLLAVFAHRGGTAARRVTLAVTAVPLVCYAPVALATGWRARRLAPVGYGEPGAARGMLTSVVGWTSVGLVVAVGTTLALAAMRGRRPQVAVPAVGAVVGLGVVAAGLQLFTAPETLTAGGPLRSTMTPLLGIVHTGFQRYQLGAAAAWSTSLLAILAVLGIAAVAVLLAVRARVEYAPAGGTARTRNPVPLVVTAALLLGLLAVVGYALTPWLRSMFGGLPLPKNDSTSRILVFTWLPPLVSALVGVFVALLGGIGIGALRPLGTRSELLLLIFAPWLFVGTGPLAVADFERAKDWHQLDTFLGLIPPTWLSIPALVVFTLLFRGLSGQWRSAGGGYDQLLRTVALPALPMLGGAMLLSWLAGAQQHLWPWLIASSPERGTAGVVAVQQMRTYTAYPDQHSSAVGLVYPLPLLVLFVVAFVALGIWYLHRLAIQVGPEPQSVPPPDGRTPAQPECTTWHAHVPADRLAGRPAGRANPHGDVARGWAGSR